MTSRIAWPPYGPGRIGRGGAPGSATSGAPAAAPAPATTSWTNTPGSGGISPEARRQAPIYRASIDRNHPGLANALKELGVSSLDDPRLNVSDFVHIRGRLGHKAIEGNLKAGGFKRGGVSLAAKRNMYLHGMDPQRAGWAAEGKIPGGERGGFDVTRPGATGAAYRGAPTAPVTPAGAARGPRTATGGIAGRALPPGGATRTPVKPAGGGTQPPASLRGMLEQQLRDLMSTGTNRQGIFEQRLEANLPLIGRQIAAMGTGRSGMADDQIKQLYGGLLADMGEAEIADKFNTLGQVRGYTGDVAQEALQRELAQLQAKTQMGIATAQEKAAMARLQAQLGFQRERGTAEDRFRLMDFGEGRRRYDTELGLTNREYEYRLSRDPVEDSFRRAALLGQIGYGGRPEAGAGAAIDAFTGGSAAHGAQAGAINQGLGAGAAALPWLLNRQPLTPVWNPNARGNLTQSGWGGY